MTGIDYVAVFDGEANEILLFKPGPDGDTEVLWHPFLVPQANELILFDGSKTLYRYSLR